MGIVKDEAGLTEIVVAAMTKTTSPRLRIVMEFFVRHMHTFASEIRLTSDELDLAVDFLNRVGQATNDTHNEGILLADVLGISALVSLMHTPLEERPEAASALLGPFWREHSPITSNGDSILRCPIDGIPLDVQANVIGPDGLPIEDVTVDVWQASPLGLYENQDEGQVPMNLRGKFRTDSEGRFWFRALYPAGYPVPTHGPTGELLRAQGREPMRPAHLHFLLSKPGFKTLITQVFVDNQEALESDVVFGVTPALLGEVTRSATRDGTADRLTLTRTFAMKPGESVLPIPPIK